MRLGAIVVEVLNVACLGAHARELLPGAEGAVDDVAHVESLELRADERTALARLHMLELDDPPYLAVELDVHAVLEAVGVNLLGHGGAGYLAESLRGVSSGG